MVKLKFEENLFNPNWVPERWTKSYQHSQFNPMKSKGKSIIVYSASVATKSLSKYEKFKRLRLMLKESCSELASNEFEARFEKLSQLFDVWNRNQEWTISIVLDEML